MNASANRVGFGIGVSRWPVLLRDADRLTISAIGAEFVTCPRGIVATDS